MPMQYPPGILGSTGRARGVGLFDAVAMGEVFLRGGGAARAVQRV